MEIKIIYSNPAAPKIRLILPAWVDGLTRKLLMIRERNTNPPIVTAGRTNLSCLAVVRFGGCRECRFMYIDLEEISSICVQEIQSEAAVGC